MNQNLQAVCEKLCERGFLAEVVPTPEDARNRILDLIGDRSVGIAGSATVRDLGLYEALTARGNTVYWHWKVEKPQVEATRIAAIGADVYLCSTNAVTEDGRLVNIDGTGNRLAGMIYGPKTVILTVGRNKLVKDFDEAIARIKRDACGPNARRQNFKTPCSIDNVCRDCRPPVRMCNVTAITEYPSRRHEAYRIILPRAPLFSEAGRCL